MTDKSAPLTEAEIRDFLDRLTRFRTTLSPRQQVLLEEMTAAALGPEMGESESAEVMGYTALEFTFLAQIPVVINTDEPSTDEHGWLTGRCSK